MSKYLQIIWQSDKPKTTVWRVENTETMEVLGFIKWYGGWRKYVFYPIHYPGETSWYDADCLIMIGNFCDNATKEHKL